MPKIFTTATRLHDTLWILAVMVITFALTCCSVAQAQIQPVYVRPSKGAAVVALTGVTAAPATSALYDFSAFESMLIYIDCGGSLCGGTTVDIRGSLTKTGPDFLISDPNGRVNSIGGATFYNYTVSQLPPFIKFQVSIVDPGVTLSITFVPVPFNERTEVSGSYVTGILPTGQVSPIVIGGTAGVSGRITQIRTDSSGRLLTGAATVATASAATSVTNAATQVHSSSTSICSVYVVNTDTTDVYCSETNAVTSSTGIPLNAASAANKSGGSYTFSNYGGNVFCITAAGSTTVRVQSNSCN